MELFESCSFTGVRDSGRSKFKLAGQVSLVPCYRRWKASEGLCFLEAVLEAARDWNLVISLDAVDERWPGWKYGGGPFLGRPQVESAA